MANYDAKTKDNKCIFCEIAKGTLKTPGLFWEDDKYMAFLAIDPNTEGFTCVIPKKHHGSDIMKMEDSVLQEFILVGKTVSKILENHYEDVGRIGVIMEGTGIDHAHIKLVPMHGTKELKEGIWKQYLSKEDYWYDEYEGFIHSGGGAIVSDEELKKLADSLKKSQ